MQAARVRDAIANGDAGVLFIGDSITQGWEREGKEAWDKHFAPRGAINLGIGGDRTQHVLWRLADLQIERLASPAAGKPPAIAVVMIGTNNTGSDTPEQIDQGVGAILASLRQRLPNTKILLLAIFPREFNPEGPLRKKVAATNALLARRAVPERVAFVDLAPVLLEPDGRLSPEVMPDQLHLSPEGYRRWAEAIAPAIAGALKAR